MDLSEHLTFPELLGPTNTVTGVVLITSGSAIRDSAESERNAIDHRDTEAVCTPTVQ